MGSVLSSAGGVKSYTLDSGPFMRPPWIGFNINVMAYFFFLQLNEPERIILQRYQGGVDPASFDGSLGMLEPAAPGRPTRWRHTMDLLERGGPFFALSQLDQVELIRDFFREGFAFGERLRPQ
jgi:hypothetical protein